MRLTPGRGMKYEVTTWKRRERGEKGRGRERREGDDRGENAYVSTHDNKCRTRRGKVA